MGLILAVSAAAAAPHAQADAFAPADCTVDRLQPKAPRGTTITAAAMVDADEPGFTWRTLRFPGDLPRLKTMTEILSPLDPDLRPFKKRGGKLIMYHGWADPAISAYGTLDYHDKVTKVVGGPREADTSLRTYFVPGMHHCSGGPGPNSFDMLPVLEGGRGIGIWNLELRIRNLECCGRIPNSKFQIPNS